MTASMKDRRVVLTGVSRGIGFETAKLLLSEGARVLGVARDQQRLDAAHAALSALGDYSGVLADVGAPAAVETIAAAARRRFDALDVLINNAAVQNYTEGFEAEGPELLERVTQVNVLGPHRLILALLPLLKAGVEPRIINVSSGAGRFEAVRDEAKMPSYRLTKYALNGLTMLYATELCGTVAVNSLDPGWLKTDMGGAHAPGEPVDGARRIRALLDKPANVTGKFWYGEEEIRF